MERFKDRLVIVTGANGGIGEAILAALTAEEARIVACDTAFPDAAPPVHARETFDLTDFAAARDAAARIVARHGPPDAVINNAGLTRAETMQHLTPAAIDGELALNLTGVIHFTQGLLPAMAGAGRGAVVFLSSVNATLHFGNPAYSAAKAGVEAFARAIAVEHGRDGLRANVVRPGSTRTRAWDHRIDADPGLLPKVAALYPMGRLVTPEEVAAAVLFLASDHASGISGVSLAVDGGATAGFLPFIDTVLR